MALQSGDRLGPYEIRARIGAGGMGEVYHAVDARLRRSVAIKIVSEHLTSATDRVRLEREAQAVAALSHPNILSIFDVGTEGEIFYVVTELLEGRTLREQLREGPVPVATATDFASQAAAALQSAHAKGIIHRDIKPENLFVTDDGRLKVLDFGLARLTTEADQTGATAEQLTAPDTVVGTIGYMSPEQLRGETLDPRTDIFSLGCVLYEMLGGRPPFLRVSQTATVAAILNDLPDYERLGHLSPRLLAVVQRCLAKRAADRYGSAGELAADLSTTTGAGLVSLSQDAPTVALPSGSRPRQRRTVVFAAVAALAIAGIVTATIIATRSENEAPRATAADAQGRAMIAVLPFENLGGDPSQEYLIDGLTEDTTTEFGRVSPERLGVVARSSAMRYKKTRPVVQTIGRELGVDYVVQGSVRRAGNRVRVAAQLVRTTDGMQVWGEIYDRTLDDVFAMQSELARDVATAVRVKIAPAPGSSRQASVPSTSAGRDAFLRGRYHLGLGTADDRRKAVQYLEESLASDPSSALVHAELARALHAQATIDTPPHEVIPKARIHVEKALELDDTLAEAHEVFGTLLLEYYWNWPEAEREIDRAIELDPNVGRARAVRASLLVSSGRIPEGMREAAAARALDPVAPVQHRNFLYQLFVARQWNVALEQARRVIDLDPQYDLAYAVVGLAHLARGEIQPAASAAEKVITVSKTPLPRAIAAYVYAHTGRRDAARQLIRELELAAEKRFVCFYNIATVYAALGDKEKAFAALERAIRDRSG